MAERIKQDKNQLTKEDILTTPSRKILFECLVKGLKIKEAAKEANVSYRYARKWVAESGANILALKETSAKTEDRREKRLIQLDAIIDNPDTSVANRLKAMDLQGKMCGWHSQTTVLETMSRQRQLSEAEQQEARRLAILRFSPQYALPAQFEDKEVLDVPGQGQAESSESQGATETQAGYDMQGYDAD